MKPLQTTMVFRSNTFTIKALFLRTAMLALLSALINAGYAGGVPKFFCVLSALMLLREVCRLLISIPTAPDEAATLSVTIRGMFPGAPALRPADLAKLIRQGSLTVQGQHNSTLQASISSPYRIVGLRQGRTVRVAFHPGDFGLQQFDRIMHDLGHITAVAVAIEAINSKSQGTLNVAASDTISPLAKPPVPELQKWPAIASGLWHALTEGFKDGLTPEHASGKP